ncbi:MAG: hypothetical protein NVS2B7_14500 [Herpetosiphon sp.]
MQPLKASVVIPSLNAPLIRDVVGALQRQTIAAAEVIVVGRDDLGLLSGCEAITFLDSGRPIGPAAARNRGAAVARSELLVFLDADCIPAPDWLDRLSAAHSGGALVACGSVSFRNTNYWTVCDNLATFAGFLTHSPAGQRGHVPSLNLSIRSTVFAECGGFDERFPAPAGEDTDLSFRLRMSGIALQFVPGAVVEHRPARSTPAAMWRHLHRFGATYATLQPRYQSLLGRSIRVQYARRRPHLLRLVAPILALLDIACWCRADPRLLRYWVAAPGVILGRAAWYYGLADGSQEDIRTASATDG